MIALAHVTDFYGGNGKSYGPRNPFSRSGFQVHPSALKKVKTPRQYPSCTSITLLSVFNINVLSGDGIEEEF